MLKVWKTEPHLLPVAQDCELSLGLDKLMDPIRGAECIQECVEIAQSLAVMQQPTPETPSVWTGEHDALLSNLSSLSPSTNWFEI
jgi:hypothetical protein